SSLTASAPLLRSKPGTSAFCRHAAAKLGRYPWTAFRWSRFAGFSLAESLAEPGKRRLAAASQVTGAPSRAQWRVAALRRLRDAVHCHVPLADEDEPLQAVLHARVCFR